MRKIDIIRIGFITMLGVALFTISLNARSSGIDNRPAVSDNSSENNTTSVTYITPDTTCEPSEPIQSIPEDIVQTAVELEEEQPQEYYIYLTESEIHDFATLVFLEAGCESFECQLGVASVVLNRMTTQGLSLNDVIYAQNQFSPAHLIPYYEPSESTLEAVRHVIRNGPTLPEYVTFFRANYYHSFSGVADYINIDSTYFSYDISLKNKLDCEV